MNRLVINADLAKTRISKHIYGHFAEHLGRCIYEGLWVGTDSAIPNTRGIRNDVVAALKKLNIPNVRWPGGCFADAYHWKDGIGPRQNRPSIVNVHWGGVTENNHFGTHEFFDLCQQLGTEPYICGNVGSGTVREMAEWLEYITMPGKSPMADLRRKNGREEPWDIKYWSVGNENWGCGGNMRPQYYADEYRRFQCYCHHFGGKKLYKVACGFFEDWNDVIMRDCHQFMDGLSLHQYTIPGEWSNKGSATQFDSDRWYVTLSKALKVDEMLVKNSGIMDRYDPAKRIGIIFDEWGTWYDVEPGTNPGFLYQQNTMRDALVAAVHFDIFHQHAGRVHMANIAQTVNVLQAMVLTEGAKMLCTPTYHVFEMFKVHQDALLVPTLLETKNVGPEKDPVPQLHASASRDAAGKVHVSLSNLDIDNAVELTCDIRGLSARSATGRILTSAAMNAHNTFDKPDAVKPVDFADMKLAGNTLTVKVPSKSIIVLEIT